MGVVVLVSGGIDSLVMSKMFEKENQDIFPLFVDYGQLAVDIEWKACKKVFEKTNLPKPVKMNINGFGKIIKSGITDSNLDIQKDAFLPGRNLLLISIAASYAYQLGENIIGIGLLDEKQHLFPDQTSEFLINTNFAINSAFNRQYTIVTPLITFSKKGVIKLARNYNLPIDETYSCHTGEEKYCGECIACKEIISSGEHKQMARFKKGDE
jgi:7-cyano-7-deazaguanine synthase